MADKSKQEATQTGPGVTGNQGAPVDVRKPAPISSAGNSTSGSSQSENRGKDNG